MKGFKEAYESIFDYYNEHGSHENSSYTSKTCIEFILFSINLLWISYMVTN